MCGNVILSSRIKEDFPGEVMFEQRGKWSEGENLADAEGRTFPGEGAEAGSRQMLGGMRGNVWVEHAAAAVESKAGGRNLTFVATGQSEVAEPSFPLSCPSDPSATPWGRQGPPAYLTEGDCNEPLLAVTSPVLIQLRLGPKVLTSKLYLLLFFFFKLRV